MEKTKGTFWPTQIYNVNESMGRTKAFPPPSGCWMKDITKEKFSMELLLFNCSFISDSVIPWTAACQAFLSFTVSWNLLKLMSIELMMPSNHLILCQPLILLPSIFPNIRVFSNESALCIRWPKYSGFNFSISPSSDRIDFL